MARLRSALTAIFGLLAGTIAIAAAPPARAEQIRCPDVREPWMLASDGGPPGTIVMRDGAARADCTYRHRAAGTTASVTFVWLPRDAPAAPDPLLRCDPAVFAHQDPGSHFNAGLGAYVHPSHFTLGYVAISPAPPGERDDASRWDAMRWTAQFALSEQVEPRAARCRRTPGRDVTERTIAPGSARVEVRHDRGALTVTSRAEVTTFITLAREPVRGFRARAGLKVIGGAGSDYSHMAGVLLTREPSATHYADGDVYVGTSFVGDRIVLLRRDAGAWREIAARPTDLVDVMEIAIERAGDTYMVTVDGSPLGRAQATAGVDWVRFAIDGGVMVELHGWRIDSLP